MDFRVGQLQCVHRPQSRLYKINQFVLCTKEEDIDIYIILDRKREISAVPMEPRREKIYQTIKVTTDFASL